MMKMRMSKKTNEGKTELNDVSVFVKHTKKHQYIAFKVSANTYV